MPQYRIYPIDNDGHISAPPEIVDCTDEQEAIQKAQQAVDATDTRAGPARA